MHSTTLSPGLCKALNMALRSLPSTALFNSCKANITENDNASDFHTYSYIENNFNLRFEVHLDKLKSY
jgi:hypothetical protein